MEGESRADRFTVIRTEVREAYARMNREQALDHAHRLANDPNMRFPDEELEDLQREAELDSDEEDNDASECRKMMEMIEEHQEALGSKLYVDLANITGNLSKLERRAKRMRKKIKSELGSDCSALIPSDVEDAHIDEDDYGSESDASDYSIASNDNVPASKASTDSSQAGEEVENAEESEKQSVLNPSGYFMKYRGTYYAVPKRHIMRDYKRTMVMPSREAMRKRVWRGHRAQEWKWEPIDPSKIVVVQMKNRTVATTEHIWCVTMRLDDSAANPKARSDDSKILHVLPETTIVRLVRAMKADPEMETSSLLHQYLPEWIIQGPYLTTNARVTRRNTPIPGPSRRDELYGPTHGNYWPRLRLAKRIRSAIDPTPSELAESDDEHVRGTPAAQVAIHAQIARRRRRADGESSGDDPDVAPPPARRRRLGPSTAGAGPSRASA